MSKGYDVGLFPCGCNYPDVQIIQDHPDLGKREFHCVRHGTYFRQLEGIPVFLEPQPTLPDAERAVIHLGTVI